MSAPQQAAVLPMIDLEAIADYCEVVFGYVAGFVPVRLLAEAGASDQRPILEFPRTDAVADRLIVIARDAAERQRGVFVVPGTVARPGSAKAADIAETAVILVDLDEGDIAGKRDHLVRHLGPASLEVASGGKTGEGHSKLHLYWQLTEAAVDKDLSRAVAARSAIARKVGGDPAFGSLHQPIRVAGTVHGKNGRSAPVRLLARTTHEYELADLVEAAASMPPLPGLVLPPASEARQRATAPRELATRRIRAGGENGETRFGALSSVIGHWLRNARMGVCTLTEAWTAVRDHNTAMIDPPWPEGRLRREFEALLEKDVAEKGGMTDPARGRGSLGDRPPSAPALSDDAIAGEFVALHGRSWKHVPVWDAWHRWSGTVWQRDETDLVRELVRQACRSAAQQASTPAEARRLASGKTISAVLRVAEADPAVAVRSSAWDTHPMLLNTPSGVVDLETGEVSPHDPTLLISQVTAASPGTRCPRWSVFLDEITEGDADLRSYLGRLAGYCLTGSTTEQVFAFLHGGGANGKSVFLNILASVMGSYAATAALDTFMASKAERHLTELAGLRAARLVLVSETEAGRSWAEARIKAVTGGERVRANFMRRDHFEFTPQFKLLVAGNHRPSFTGVGEAMCRRLHLVPFEMTIPPEHRDTRLAEKLLAERDGILGWMLEGCAEWQRIGLAPPDCVRAAAEDYFDAEDLVGQWIGERCLCGVSHRARASVLFQSWKSWAEAGGFPPGSQKALGEALRARGFRPIAVQRARGWQGIAARTGAQAAGEVG